MKLSYDVLWFEDQFETLQPNINRLSKFVERKGFVLNIEKRTSITHEEIYKLGDKLDKSNPYDIIIFDFDMGRGVSTGVDIAHKLRANIYTDMVLYSGGEPEGIDQIVFDKRLQGVFVIHKTGFFDNISPIINDHIKKISSLNGARGMVMSEWSKIEIDLRKYLVESVKSLDGSERQKHEKKILKRLIDQTSVRLTKLEKHPCIYDLVEDSIQCDFSIIRRSLKTLKDNETSIFDDCKDIHLVQKERNLLAHNKQDLQEDGSLLLTTPKGEEKRYDLVEFERLRNSLIELKNKLEVTIGPDV